MKPSLNRSAHDSLLCSEHYAKRALERLDSSTEYLRDELEDHLARLQTLLGKMNHDEALERDRAFLLSDDPLEGIAEYLGSDDDG